MSLLPSAMKDSDPIPTGLGKKIEPLPKPEVQHGTEVAPGVFDVGGKLETRIEKNEEANQPTTLEQAWSFMHGLREPQKQQWFAWGDDKPMVDGVYTTLSDAPGYRPSKCEFRDGLWLYTANDCGQQGMPMVVQNRIWWGPAC